MGSFRNRDGSGGWPKARLVEIPRKPFDNMAANIASHTSNGLTTTMTEPITTAISTEERLIRLETALAHTQHDLEQMHEALLSLHAELRGNRHEIARLERRLVSLGEGPEIRDPGDEQPPHY